MFTHRILLLLCLFISIHRASGQLPVVPPQIDDDTTQVHKPGSGVLLVRKPMIEVISPAPLASSPTVSAQCQ